MTKEEEVGTMKALGKKPPAITHSGSWREVEERAAKEHYRTTLLELALEVQRLRGCSCKNFECPTCELRRKILISAGVETKEGKL